MQLLSSFMTRHLTRGTSLKKGMVLRSEHEVNTHLEQWHRNYYNRNTSSSDYVFLYQIYLTRFTRFPFFPFFLLIHRYSITILSRSKDVSKLDCNNSQCIFFYRMGIIVTYSFISISHFSFIIGTNYNHPHSIKYRTS